MTFKYYQCNKKGHHLPLLQKTHTDALYTLYVNEKAQMFALVLIMYVSALFCTVQCCTATNELSIHALNPQAVGIDEHCISILTILQRINVTLIEGVTFYTVYPFFRCWPFTQAYSILSYGYFHLWSYSHSTPVTSIPLKLCKPGVLVYLMELPLISSIKRGISIFHLVCMAHLKGLGHKMPYFSTGYASR